MKNIFTEYSAKTTSLNTKVVSLKVKTMKINRSTGMLKPSQVKELYSKYFMPDIHKKILCVG